MLYLKYVTNDVSTTPTDSPKNHGVKYSVIVYMLSSIMSNDYPFTQSEYAKILGISKEALRSRRRAGKLEDEYILKSNCYFYKRAGPNHDKTTPNKPPVRQRRRGVHAAGLPTKYKSNALKQHNEMKMLAKLKFNVDDEIQNMLPEAINHVIELKKERLKDAAQPKRIENKNFRNYGTGLINCKHARPQYKPLGISNAEPKIKSYY